MDRHMQSQHSIETTSGAATWGTPAGLSQPKLGRDLQYLTLAPLVDRVVCVGQWSSIHQPHCIACAMSSQMGKAIAVVCLALLAHGAAALNLSLFWSSRGQQDSHKPRHGEITSLPGYSGQLPSKHYGGYVSVGSRQLYYYLVESERSPADDPVVLWLNGGPGCSSFDGWVYEQGPFKLHLSRDRNEVTLQDNPFAWNKVANMIFLDSPSPVGMSYSTHHSDYFTNDTATAADSHAFLRGFFKRYPHLQQNDFYIAGESYAGIYVPMLTKEVVKGNKRGVEPHINIKGYMVGNGCTDQDFDGNAQVPFAVGKSLISTTLYQRVEAACKGNYWDVEEGSRCEQLLAQVSSELKSLNLYNILEDCHHDTLIPAGLRAQQQERLAALRSSPHASWPLTGRVQQGKRVHNWATLLGHNPPCTVSREAEIWLNDPEVRAALYAAPHELTGPWVLCSDRILYTANGGSMLPVHNYLVRKAGLRALIYSGDHDLCVPHTGSEAWTSAMHRSDSEECNLADEGADDSQLAKCDGVVNPWQPWYNSDSPKQVAGYVVDYTSGLSYATVKGAGHMVPETNPREALDMFTRFISGQTLTARHSATTQHSSSSSSHTSTSSKEAIATA